MKQLTAILWQDVYETLENARYSQVIDTLESKIEYDKYWVIELGRHQLSEANIIKFYTEK